VFILSLLWVLLGILIGTLANGARLGPASWGRRGWLYLPGAGVLLALLGGWLSTLLLGTLFATVTAIWVTVVGVIVVGWLGKYLRQLQKRRRSLL
jgi:hypothetical protein